MDVLHVMLLLLFKGATPCIVMQDSVEKLAGQHTRSTDGSKPMCFSACLSSHPPSPQGNMGLRFQHPAPVQPGALGNIGWREEENLARQGADAATAGAAAAAVVAPAKAAAADGSLGMYTMEEVEQHATEESAWFVHEGKVSTEWLGFGSWGSGGAQQLVLCSPTSPAQRVRYCVLCCSAARAGLPPVTRPVSA